MPRTRDLIRSLSRRAIAKKREIVTQVYGLKDAFGLHQPHRLSKNKVHCSCALCRGERYTRRRKHAPLLELGDCPRCGEYVFPGQNWPCVSCGCPQ